MNDKMSDPEVINAIDTLKKKGVTLDQITQHYTHYYSEIPTPGSTIQWNYGVRTVLPNHSNIYPVEQGYIRIQNSSLTDLYLLPHEYRVMSKYSDSTETA